VTDFSPRREPTQVSAPELTAVLAQQGAVVLAAETIDTTIKLVATLAVRTIPGTSGAGVTLLDGRGKRTTAASDPLVEQADELQYQFDSGPCLTAWRDQVSVRVDDIDSETRWPQWTAAVAGLGVRAVVSAPLLAQDATTTQGAGLGAIKVYSSQPNAYDRRAEQLLELFARQAAILLANTQTLSDARRLSAELTQALDNRDIIGQAKGVLIAQGADDEQSAFQMLVSASQRSNTRLHDLARQLVASTHVGRPRGRRSDRAGRSHQV
jgi:GAF domain-containing protein